MSTRCNVVIKKGNDKVYLYHHHDGYPSGVGKDIIEYMEYLCEAVSKEEKDEILSTPQKLAEWLCSDERDDEYEFTDCLHGDIEYLYEIYLDSDAVACFDAFDWTEKGDWEDTEKQDDLIYSACLYDSWSEIEREIEKERENKS